MFFLWREIRDIKYKFVFLRFVFGVEGDSIAVAVLAKAPRDSLNHLRCRRAESVPAEAVAERILELGDLRHHGQRVLRLLLHLRLELVIFHAHALNLVAQLGDFVRGLAAGPALALHARALAVVVVGRAGRVGLGRGAVGARVHAAEVLVQVLLAREALAGVALAVGMRAVDRVLGPAVLVVNFALVSKEAARVGEAGEVLATLGRAAVGAFMLVHVFAASC